MGGMNEEGLVLEHLHLPDSVYPDGNSSLELLEFEWIQYVLDTCATTQDIESVLKAAAIKKGRIGMHFIAADKNQKLLLVEFKEGTTVLHTDTFAQLPIVTNDWYEASCANVGNYEGFGGSQKVPFGSTDSIDRFAVVADALTRIDKSRPRTDLISSAMEILASVKDSTLLSVVYDPLYKKITYNSSLSPTSRTLHLEDFDFSSGPPSAVIDIHDADLKITPYDRDTSIQLMQDMILPNCDFLRLEPYLHNMMERQ